MVPMMLEKNRRLFDARVDNGGDDGIPMMDDVVDSDCILMNAKGQTF